MSQKMGFPKLYFSNVIMVLAWSFPKSVKLSWI